uniref:Ankyrin 3 n=1 Tax=Pipistrellus kuhlii TaxID=59472 RepID=A0A7J7VAD8_PIPKU|nr:ankyrin 3 [Pipistrellus kuhlii]
MASSASSAAAGAEGTLPPAQGDYGSFYSRSSRKNHMKLLKVSEMKFSIFSQTANAGVDCLLEGRCSSTEPQRPSPTDPLDRSDSANSSPEEELQCDKYCLSYNDGFLASG